MKASLLTLCSTLVILNILLLVSACTDSKGDKGCIQFKSGDFVYNFRGQKGSFLFLISRKDSIQVEVNSMTGDTSQLSVHWTNECNYELRLLESTARYPDSILRVRKKMVIKTEIVSWTKEYYLFKSESDNPHFILSDTLWIKK